VIINAYPSQDVAEEMAQTDLDLHTVRPYMHAPHFLAKRFFCRGEHPELHTLHVQVDQVNGNEWPQQ
jgi:hypothetical protein